MWLEDANSHVRHQIYLHAFSLFKLSHVQCASGIVTLILSARIYSILHIVNKNKIACIRRNRSHTNRRRLSTSEMHFQIERTPFKSWHIEDVCIRALFHIRCRRPSALTMCKFWDVRKTSIQLIHSAWKSTIHTPTLLPVLSSTIDVSRFKTIKITHFLRMQTCRTAYEIIPQFRRWK